MLVRESYVNVCRLTYVTRDKKRKTSSNLKRKKKWVGWSGLITMAGTRREIPIWAIDRALSQPRKVHTTGRWHKKATMKRARANIRRSGIRHLCCACNRQNAMGQTGCHHLTFCPYQPCNSLWIRNHPSDWGNNSWRERQWLIPLETYIGAVLEIEKFWVASPAHYTNIYSADTYPFPESWMRFEACYLKSE